MANLPKTTDNYDVKDYDDLQTEAINKIENEILSLGRELAEQRIAMRAYGGDLVAAYNAMLDGEVAGFYTYNCQASNGWPETASNNNTMIIFKMIPSYGLAISMCGSNAYMARITQGGFAWRKLT